MPSINLRCGCGKIKGVTKHLDSDVGTRINCCCKDCQLFSQYLKKEDVTLDKYGGTDIFQMPISYMNIVEGADHISCIRLTENGLYRWYAGCCDTPIGNTLGPRSPFIGVIHNFMDNTVTREQDLGTSRGYIHIQSAKGTIPEAQIAPFFNTTFRIVSKLLLWKMKGFDKPSAFFNQSGNPIVEPEIFDQQSSN